jgi:hypothetical protein
MLCNASAARRRYAEKCPNRRLASEPTFIAVDHRGRETGSLRRNRHVAGRLRSVVLEEDVLDTVKVNPRSSTRRIAAGNHTSQSTVSRILRRERLHVFHYQPVQSLFLPDRSARPQFCQWFLDQQARDPVLTVCVLFTEEAMFTRDDVFNYHNEHVGARQNPHATRESHFQRKFSVKVLAEIVGDTLLGPHMLPARLTGELHL